jgi:hypothetical protein
MNRVEASVSTHVSGTSIRHSLDLVVPTLDGYTYNIPTISHGPSIYPVRELDKYKQFDTESAFIEWLGATLSSPDTKRIVSNLLAQVAA